MLDFSTFEENKYLWAFFETIATVTKIVYHKNYMLFCNSHSINIQLYVKLEEVWVSRAGLKIKSKDAIIRDLEIKFSGYGLAHNVSRETVTGNYLKPKEAQPCSREKRATTELSTAKASMKKGSRCQAGKKKSGGKSK